VIPMFSTDSSVRADLSRRARELVGEELVTYAARTIRSQQLTDRARRSLPAGVASSFQAYDPHPVVAASAAGGHLIDVDGNRYLDLNMGFGALFAGHVHPIVREAVDRQLDRGTLFVTPSETNTEVAELLAARFGLPMWRFTNSGTEATMDAIRVARGITGRHKIVKVEGGYHGHHDEVMISMKPPLDRAGPADRPTPVPATAGITPGHMADTLVIPYNDTAALERVLNEHDGEVAAFIVEPAMQNIGICMPQPGYLSTVREITRRHGTMLIFDEVKTGITAGYNGATGHFGVKPDLIALAKSIGGGFPIGAFGGSAECMDQIASGKVLHLGTYNGNPLVMAAALAVLRDVCTPEVTADTIARNTRLVARCGAIAAKAGLPSHTVQLGAKGCVTYSVDPVRNYRDYKATDFDLAFANWIFGINRGILLPPGLDEQWLISVMHTDEDVDMLVGVFEEFVQTLGA
jgi:glutamate-1-semialdehyde 2,1-aminomutase